MNGSVEKNELLEVSSVFEQPWWLDVVAPGMWNESIVTDKSGNCIGRLPYVNITKYGVTYCGLPALTPYIGPWIKIESNMKTVAVLKRIKQVSEAFIEELNTKSNVDIYFNHYFQYVLPFIWSGYSVEPKFTYIIDTLTDLDVVFQGMEAKVRNLIRNAEKKYLVTDKVSQDDMVRLIKDTYKKQGRNLPMEESTLRCIYDEAFKHDAGKIIGARNKESKQLDAVAFFIYDSKSCYYLVGGKDYTKNAVGVQELILWEGIKFAATVAEEFNFEGSMVPSIESFFRGFGGVPRVYYRIYRAGLIYKCLSRLKYFVIRVLGYK